MDLAICQTKLKKSIAYFTLTVCVFLFAVKTSLNVQNKLSLNLTQSYDNQKHLSLMGQFNYKLSLNYMSKDIIMAVPDCESHGYPKLNSSSYLCYKSDYGFYSPYVNIAKVLKTSENSGILYIHDDMLITSSLRKKMVKAYWVIAKPGYDGIKLYKNGTTITNNTSLQNWIHWMGTVKYGDRIGCFRVFNDIMNDPDMSNFLHKTNNDEPFLNVQCGQSDFLYAFFPNSKQKEYFVNILELFAKYKLFLECAIPTAVLIIVITKPFTPSNLV